MYQIWLEDGLLPLNLQEKVQNIPKRRRIYGFPSQCVYFSQIYKWSLRFYSHPVKCGPQWSDRACQVKGHTPFTAVMDAYLGSEESAKTGRAYLCPILSVLLTCLSMPLQYQGAENFRCILPHVEQKGRSDQHQFLEKLLVHCCRSLPWKIYDPCF